MDETYIGRTSEVGSSNVQSLGMHKKSIEAAKALKEDDASCDDGEANGSESGRCCHRNPPPVSSSAPVEASLDHHQAPASGRESADPSAGGGGTGSASDDALRSESLAALRAKVYDKI